MQLGNIQLTGELRFRYVVAGDETGDYQINLFTATATDKVTPNFYDLYFYNFPNGTVFGSNIQEDLNINNYLIGIGDGTTTDFSANVTPTPVKLGNSTLNYTTSGTSNTATDDVNGDFTGTDLASGNIQADGTGGWSFSTAPDNGTPITLNYVRGISSDDSLLTGFKFVLGLDENPTLDNSPCNNPVSGITVVPTIVDRYERESQYIYEVKMNATYSGADTNNISVVGVYYEGVEGTAAGTTGVENLVLKSIAPFKQTTFSNFNLIADTHISLNMRIIIAK